MLPRLMSHVDFKKSPCRRVEFKGLGEYKCPRQIRNATILGSSFRVYCTVYFGDVTANVTLGKVGKGFSDLILKTIGLTRTLSQ